MVGLRESVGSSLRKLYGTGCRVQMQKQLPPLKLIACSPLLAHTMASLHWTFTPPMV